MDSIRPNAAQQALVNSVSARKNKRVTAKTEPENEPVIHEQARDGRDGLPGRDGADGIDGIPGRDGVTPDINEIAALVPVAKDGMPGAQGLHGADGIQGKDGMPGRDGVDGKDGKSITSVNVDANNNLIVAIDGNKRKVGTIMPQERAPFSGASGGGTSGIFARKGSLIFNKNYTSGDTVEAKTVVNDDGWLMSSNQKTDEPAAVHRIGNEFNVYTGTLDSVSLTAKQILFGTRYTSVDFASINGYRIDTIVGNEYTVYLVKDPLGDKIINELITFTGIILGFQTFNTTPVIIGPNEIFDIVVLVREPNPTPTVVNINYRYKTPNNADAPNEGDINHANKLTSSLYISKIDDDGTDQSAFLSTLDIGDLITGPNITWSIQSSTDAGNYFDFVVAPTVQDSPDGVFSFTFETTTATPITLGEDIGFWNGSLVAQGLFIADGPYDNIVSSDTARGVDLIVQKIDKSDHWDVMMPAATQTSGGSAVSVRLDPIGSFSTEASQLIGGLGAAGVIRLNYGLGGTTPGSEFTIAPDGVILCNTANIQYHFRFQLRLFRNGAAGVSELMLRLMYAPDGIEVNAIQIQNTFIVEIDNPRTIWRESFEFDFEPAQGSLMWIEAARNPSGDDSGDIGTNQPSGDLSGWNPSKSVTLDIERYVTS